LSQKLQVVGEVIVCVGHPFRKPRRKILRGLDIRWKTRSKKP
jgi:hypothetical protein